MSEKAILLTGYSSSEDAVMRRFLTPEGTPIYMTVARIGDRVGAFFLDILFMGVLLLISKWILSAIIFHDPYNSYGNDDLQNAVTILIATSLRLFYFTWMELRYNGATFGKTRHKMRVVDATGGQLTSEAVLTRNFMRELEFWLPLQVMFSRTMLITTHGTLVSLLASLWILIILIVPLLNRDRRRIGDYIAGTMVVTLPDGRLARDMGTAVPRVHANVLGPTYAFTREQLDVYGIFELELLEDVLRIEGTQRRNAMNVVSKKIATKIGWPEDEPIKNSETFLREFYRAQRAFLEQKMLLGVRKERKRTSDSGPAA
jgi:uncharacterized RDD family membrane protein YckC